MELIIPQVAAQIKELKAQRALVAQEVEEIVDAHPLTRILISLPGVGITTAATILLTAGDFSAFLTPGHLAAYAGIAPVTRRSGTSIRSEFPARSGNKQLKNALFRSAWVASCHDPVLKAYYQRKRAEGKKHNAAVICLARRRLNVLLAMVRDSSLYQAVPENIPQAACRKAVKLEVASPRLAGRVGCWPYRRGCDS